MRKKIRALALVFGAAVTLIPLIGAQADELIMLPSLDVSGRVDDNPLLQVHGAKTLYIGQVTPHLSLHKTSDRYDFSLTGSASLRGYAGLRNTNADDEVLALSGTYNTSQTTRVGLDATLNRVTILDLLQENTGQISQPARATAISVAPHAELLMNAVDVVEVEGTFANQSFGSTQLQNYRQSGATIIWKHSLSETDSLSLAATAARVDPENDLIPGTALYGALLSLAHQMPGGLTASAGIGPQFIHRSVLPGSGLKEDETGYEAELSLSDPIDELTNVTIDFDHRAQANGTGGASPRTTLTATLGRRLTPLISFNISANGLLSSSSTFVTDNVKDLYGVDAALSWQLGYFSRLSFGYYHRREQFRTIAGTAASNGIYLTFNRSFGEPAR